MIYSYCVLVFKTVLTFQNEKFPQVPMRFNVTQIARHILKIPQIPLNFDFVLKIS